MNRKDFGDDFFWGVSTAAYQIEGSITADGKGPSIWDVFSKKKNKIFNNQNGDIACDFYNKFTQDLYLIYELKIPNFRFSISWSRIFPNGTGQINQQGIDFYNRVIDLCLELNIEPWITLYHWDLPEKLQEKGGWTNRDIINWFSEFVTCCVKHFGDRVSKWIVLNEPMVFTGAGYFLGVHAPGLRGLNNFIASVHHAAMCQAAGGRIIRSLHPNPYIGTTFSHSYLEPYNTDNVKDHHATKKVDALLNRLFIEPLLGLGYPLADLSILNRIEKFIKPNDMELISFKMDFIGLQVYTRELIKYVPFQPFLQANIVNLETNKKALVKILAEIKIEKDKVDKLTQRINIATHSANIGVWELDMDSKDLNWDNQMYTLFGINKDEIFLTTDMDMIPVSKEYFYNITKQTKENSKIFTIASSSNEIKSMVL